MKKQFITMLLIFAAWMVQAQSPSTRLAAGMQNDITAKDTPFLWNATSAAAMAGYNKHVFGIAKTGEGLYQKMTKNQNEGDADILSVVLPNNFTRATHNASIAISGINTLPYLVLASNNGAITKQSTEIQAPFKARISREWHATTTNFTDGVVLKFDGFENTKRPYLQYVLLKKNGNSDFSSGATVVGPLSSAGTIAATLANDDYFTIVESQKAPGGVVTNLALWLRADDGITFTGSAIEGWLDRSPAGKDATTPGAEPTFDASSINYNPALVFTSANSTYMQVADGFADFSGGISTYTASSFAPDASNAAPPIFDFNAGPLTSNIQLYRQGNIGTLIYQNIGVNGSGTSASNPTLSMSAAVVDNQAVLTNTWQGSGTAGSLNTAFGGINNRQFSSSNIYLPSNVTRTSNFIGRGSRDTEKYLKGKIAEVIFYDRANTPLERQRINSYLAIKYGITIDQTTATNYLASDGTTVIWDAATANVTTSPAFKYDKDIAGIYRDDDQGLYQKQAASILATMNTIDGLPTGAPILSIGLNTIAASNATNTGVITNDKSGLIWSSNGGLARVGSIGNTNIPGTCITQRVARQWQIQVKNGASALSTQVKINLAGVGGTLLAATSNYVLMIDGDGDGNFTTGEASLRFIEATSFNTTTKIATFDGIHFDMDGSGSDVFALATAGSSLGAPIVVPVNTTETATTNCTIGQLVHYRSPVDNSKFIMKFNKLGHTFAPTTVRVTHTANGLTPATASGIFSETASYYQERDAATGDFLRVSRRFHTVVAPAPSGAIRVKIYFNVADTAAMIADAVPGSKPISEKGWYKIAATTAPLTINAMTPSAFTGITPIVPINQGLENGLEFVEFEVTSFSTFGYYAKSAPGCSPALVPNALVNGNVNVSEECNFGPLSYLRVPSAPSSNIAFNKNGNTINFTANPVNINNTGELNFPQGTSAGYYEISNSNTSVAASANRTNRVSDLLTHIPITQTFTAGSPVTIRIFYDPAKVGPTSAMVTTNLANGLPPAAHGWFIRDNSTPQQVLNNTGTYLMAGARPITGMLGIDAGSGLHYVDFVVTNFTNATIGYYANASVLVPIKLSSFEVLKSGKTSVVKWTTSNEVDNSRFIIERSNDGITFTSIGSVDGSGSSNAVNNYSFKDNNPLAYKNYYRLKAISVTGKTDLSAVKLLIFADANTVFIYPNPFVGNHFNAVVNVSKTQQGTVHLIGADGKRIKTNNKNFVEGNNVVKLTDLGTLPKGLYLLEVRFEDGSRQQVKVVKN